jgi:hypothetical protein
MLFSVAGISRESERFITPNNSIMTSNAGIETQSIFPYQSVYLPGSYGVHYQDIEEDKDLIEYYKEASFFDEKDFHESKSRNFSVLSGSSLALKGRGINLC